MARLSMPTVGRRFMSGESIASLARVTGRTVASVEQSLRLFLRRYWRVPGKARWVRR